MKSGQKGVYSKLQNASVPWKVKLSLARSAWDSIDCMIPNKQRVLLDWIIQELINASKKDHQNLQVSECCGLWELLLHVLQSKDQISQERISVTLKPLFLQVFTDAFLCKDAASHESTINTVIRCCNSIMSNSQLASSLLAKFESYVTFLSSLLSLFEPIHLDQSEDLCVLVKVCLHRYLLVQRQQANQRKVFSAMCQQLLGPLTRLLFCLSEVQNQKQLNRCELWTKMAQDISQLAELALTRSLFHKDHMPEYQQALKVAREEKETNSDEPAKKKPRISNYTKILFDKLWELSSDSSQFRNTSGTKAFATKEAALAILPFLLNEFVVSVRKATPSASKVVEFDFFVEVSEMMGFCKETCQDVSFVSGLLHQVLECIHLHDIYQVADDSSNGSLQFNWFKELTNDLIGKGETSEAVFRCLDVLLKLNHSLLEPHMETIWMMLWKTGNSDGVAHNCLMLSFISTYMKLRQFEKLVSVILASLRTLEVSTFSLTALFRQKFTVAIQGLPYGQIESIWNIFCGEIKEHYIQTVKLKKLRKEKSSSSSLLIWRKLEYSMSLFNTFIVNIRFGAIGEQFKRKPFLKSTAPLFQNTVKDVLKPLVDLASMEVEQKSRERESALFSALLLQHTLAELELLLNKFQVVGDNEGHETLLPSVFWSEEIGDFVPAKTTMAALISRDHCRHWYIKNALCIQSIRFALLNKKNLDQGNELCIELQKLVTCVCSSINAEIVRSESWDRQELTINENNAVVAHWDLISRNALVLLPLCNADQQFTLAQMLVKTLAQGKEGNNTAVPSFITMYDVSMTSIQDASLHEILSMQTATVCAVLSELKQCIDSTCGGDVLVEQISKVLHRIGTPRFLSHVKDNEEEMVKYDDKIDPDQEEEEEEEKKTMECDENDEGRSDEDFNNDNHNLQRMDETTEEPRVKNLKAFYALGRAVTGISKVELLSYDPVVKFSAADCQRILKVLGYLPLNWLSDDNHARCLIGLLACDVVFTSFLLKDCSLEFMKLLILSRQFLTILFDGSVSRKKIIAHRVIELESLHTWLFGSTVKLWQTFHMDPSKGDILDSVLRVTRGLMNSTVKYLLKAPSKYTCESTVQKLQEDLGTFSTDVRKCSKHLIDNIARSNHALLVAVGGFLAVCEEVLTSKVSGIKMTRISSSIVINLGPALLALLKTMAQSSQREQEISKEPTSRERNEKKWQDFLLQFPVWIDSFTCLLHIYSVSQQSGKLLLVNEKLKQCEWQLVFDVVLTTAIHHVFERNFNFSLSEKEEETVHSCLHFLKIVCRSCSKLSVDLPEDLHIRLVASSLHFLRLLRSVESGKKDERQSETENYHYKSDIIENVVADQRKDPETRDIMEEGYGLVLSLLEGCDPVLLPELLDGLCSGITISTINKDSVNLLHVSLQVWFRLLSERFIKERKKELRPRLPKVLVALQFLIQERDSGNLGIIQLAIDIMTKILSLGKGMVLPHNALLVLHSDMMVTLEDCDNRSFLQLFESQYALLSTLLFQHSEAVYEAFHVFISCVRNLLTKLLKRCDDRKNVVLETRGKEKKTEVTESAQRMARLYDEISSHKKAISKYAPYLIADYIHSVQTVAIPSAIRDTLVPGIYCLLDICGEHELSMLHAVLEKGSRELFHSLHEDYTKYHKFKGKV
ncbi:unhealthy ribosome biogenesis protein 2 homolog [Montipora foliosa]|uniref:unhealthy ribosome biogenesis protein 2 homolog n=1 Tax=Montipora foliosa TaxID=591990 RepID=UPI0035F1E164